MVEGVKIWNDDQNAGMVSLDGGQYLVVSWYKSRGATEGMWIVYGDQIHPISLEGAESILEMKPQSDPEAKAE